MAGSSTKKAGRSRTKTGPTPARPGSAAAELASLIDESEIDQLTELMKTTATESGVTSDGEVVPVQIGKKGKAAEDAEEMVHIFTLDDTEYSIPRQPNSMLLIRFLRQSQSPKVGLTQATGNLLYTLLGEDAMDSLSESRDVSKADVAKIMDIVTVIAFDALAKLIKDGLAGEGPLGNS